MNEGLLQLTLREWGAQMRQLSLWAVMLGIAVVLTIAAPFGTGDVLHPLPLFFYWSALVCLGYALGNFSAMLVSNALGPKASLLKTILWAGPLTGAVMVVLVLILNAGFFGFVPTGASLIAIVVQVFVIAFVVAATVQIALANSPTTVENTSPQPPRILDRLPFDKRAPLVAMTVEDHYVRVSTTKGHEMILIRLSDAIAEVGDTAGLQVHRSHWVALDQITHVTRDKDRARITLSNGDDVPVSRTYMPQLRQAGLLKGAANG